jgi:hypothetical protein
MSKTGHSYSTRVQRVMESEDCTTDIIYLIKSYTAHIYLVRRFKKIYVSVALLLRELVMRKLVIR